MGAMIVKISFLMCILVVWLFDKTTSNYVLVEISEPMDHEIQSRAGGNKRWKVFQHAVQKNERGSVVRVDKIGPIKPGKNTDKKAREKCQKKCAIRTTCCNACVKPRGFTNYYDCLQYKGKFGGKNDEKIEAV